MGCSHASHKTPLAQIGTNSPTKPSLINQNYVASPVTSSLHRCWRRATREAEAWSLTILEYQPTPHRHRACIVTSAWWRKMDYLHYSNERMGNTQDAHRLLSFSWELDLLWGPGWAASLLDQLCLTLSQPVCLLPGFVSLKWVFSPQHPGCYLYFLGMWNGWCERGLTWDELCAASLKW